MPVAAVVEAEPQAASARDRLIAGLAASIKERGYRETTIADIVAKARTSRRTFYEVFESKDDCFLALLSRMTEKMVAEIAAAVDPKAHWEDQVRAGVTAWITTMAADPELNMSWIRELPLLGTRAMEAQRAATGELITMLAALTDTPELRRAGVEPVSAARATVLLGGLRELAATVVEGGADLASMAEEALDATIALIGPRAPAARRSVRLRR